jgi:ferredoxin-NADP reductase
MASTVEQASRRLVVRSRRQEAASVVSLVLADPEGGALPVWEPGAHIDLVLPSGLIRQYSLCAQTRDSSTYTIAVLREEDGRGGSREVHEALHVGATVEMLGPRNHFRFVTSERCLFIAGGIGITPLLPMIGQAELLGAEWELLYGGRTRASMAFLDQLSRFGDRVRIRPQDEYGLLDLAGFLGEPEEGVRVYACGPAPLLAALDGAAADWPADAVRTEQFSAPRSPDGTTGTDQTGSLGSFTVELRRSSMTVEVGVGQSILEAVQERISSVPFSCKEGYCGSCETRVLSGTPDHRDTVLTDEEKLAGDVMMICVGRSKSGRLVLDL